MSHPSTWVNGHYPMNSPIVPIDARDGVAFVQSFDKEQVQRPKPPIEQGVARR